MLIDNQTITRPIGQTIEQPIPMIPPTPINMGVKDSGVPVNFSPADQVKMANTFGQAYQGKYDRSIGPKISMQAVQPPVGVATQPTPPYDLNN